MNFSELRDILDRRKAAIVHFSHHAKMREKVVFPSDMINAIENRNAWPLCCTALWPGHTMNLVGSVGIIFEPRSTDHIISVCETDAGSSVDRDGKSQSLGRPLSVEAVEQSLQGTFGSYNEWIVQGADVKGIFVADPDRIYVKKTLILDFPDMPDYMKSSDPEIGMTEITLMEVFESFPSHSVFTMGANGLVEVRRP